MSRFVATVAVWIEDADDVDDATEQIRQLIRGEWRVNRPRYEVVDVTVKP